MPQHDDTAPDVLGEAFFRDPYPSYERYRKLAGAVRVIINGVPVWLVVRNAEARAALTEPLLVKDQDRFARAAARLAGVDHLPPPAERSFGERVLTSHLLAMDPPEHTRLRALVGKASTMHRIKAMQPEIERQVGRLFDGVADRAETGSTRRA